MYRCLSGNEYSYFDENSEFNPQAPVAQKIMDEVVFLPFQGEGVEFFKSDLTDPTSDFPYASFGKCRFKPFQLSFFSGFKSRSCFESDGFIAYSNE